MTYSHLGAILASTVDHPSSSPSGRNSESVTVVCKVMRERSGMTSRSSNSKLTKLYLGICSYDEQYNNNIMFIIILRVFLLFEIIQLVYKVDNWMFRTSKFSDFWSFRFFELFCRQEILGLKNFLNLKNNSPAIM